MTDATTFRPDKAFDALSTGLTPLEFFLEEEGGGIEAEIVAFVTSAVRQVRRWRRP